MRLIAFIIVITLMCYTDAWSRECYDEWSECKKNGTKCYCLSNYYHCEYMNGSDWDAIAAINETCMLRNCSCWRQSATTVPPQSEATPATIFDAFTVAVFSVAILIGVALIIVSVIWKIRKDDAMIKIEMAEPFIDRERERV